MKRNVTEIYLKDRKMRLYNQINTQLKGNNCLFKEKVNFGISLIIHLMELKCTERNRWEMRNPKNERKG